MNDLETRLRDLLKDDAGRAPAPAAAPPSVRRARRRQLVLGLASLVAAVASVAALALIAMHLSPSADRGSPLGANEGETRTVQLPYARVTYPADYVVTVWHEPGVTSSFIQLASFDPDVRSYPVCSLENRKMPLDGVALTVSVQPGGGLPGEYPWPGKLMSLGTREPPRSPLCGGTYESWMMGRVEGTDLWIDARIHVGPDAPEADREAIDNIIETLSFDRPYAMDNAGSVWGNVVLASGAIDATPWLVTALPDRTQPGIELDLDLGVGPDGEEGGLRSAAVGGVIVEAADEAWVNPVVMDGNMMLFGAVSPEVARIEVRPEGTDSFDAHLADPPRSLGATFRAFVAPMRGAPRGSVVLYAGDASVIREIAFEPSRSTFPEIERPALHDFPITSGSFGGTDWQLRDAGVELDLEEVFRTGETRILRVAPRTPAPALSMATHTFVGRNGGTQSAVFGVAAPEVTQVVLFTSGVPGAMHMDTLEDGTQVYWQAFEPGELKGQVIALDADCEVLQAVDLATGEPVADPKPTSCD